MSETAWDRDEQIKRNQPAIAWIREQIRKDEAMTEEEATQAAIEFEQFKEIVDSARPPGNKLYSDD